MRNFSKNKKGFTLAEEVISLLLVSILIVTASGILVSQMRIFARNVITLTAQQKGVALMEQLADDLEYATGISDSGEPNSDPYQLVLEMTTDGLYETVNMKYSSTETSGHTTSNLICKMGNYDAAYDLTYDSTAQTIVVYLQVSRGGTVYYSERRTVALKNTPTVNFTSFDSTSDLYIACLE